MPATSRTILRSIMSKHDESETDAKEIFDTDGKSLTEPSVLQDRYDAILQNPCGPSAFESESGENVQNLSMSFEPEISTGEIVKNSSMPFEPEIRSGEKNVQNPSGSAESEGGSGENLHNLNRPREPESTSNENLRNPCKSFGPDSSRSNKSVQADTEFQDSKTNSGESVNADHNQIFRSAGRRHRTLSDSLLTQHSANEVKGKKLWERREVMRQMVRKEEQKIEALSQEYELARNKLLRKLEILNVDIMQNEDGFKKVAQGLESLFCQRYEKGIDALQAHGERQRLQGEKRILFRRSLCLLEERREATVQVAEWIEQKNYLEEFKMQVRQSKRQHRASE